MFESSLIDRQTSRRPTLRVLATSAGLHFALAATVVSAAYWTIAPVAEPREVATYYVQLAPPPPAAGGSIQSKPVQADETLPVRTPDTAQPELRTDPEPDVAPAPAASAPTDLAPIGDATDGPGVPGSPGAGGPGVPGAVDPRGAGVLPATPEGDDEPYRIVGSAIAPPVAILRVRPLYTEAARKSRTEGTVVIEAVIDESGRIARLHVVKSLPFGLDQKAAEAISQWRFRPATLNGRPVKVYFNLTVLFRLS